MLKYMRELQKGLIPTPDHTKELAKEHFAAGFSLGWEIRKELQDAGILSAVCREDPGTVISEGK